MEKKDRPDATTAIRGSPQEQNSQEEELQLQHWDRYEILECLGEGGMGKVYKAVDRSLNRHVAVKFLHSTDSASQRRFLREARSQAQIEHAHVCKIYEVGTFEGRNYIAMQFISGERLDKLRSRLGVEQKAALGLQLAEALQVAHSLGIIHRDIKPANILVEQKEGAWCAYLVDFGLARDTSVPGATKTGVVMGTPEYMSPEQAWKNPGDVDRRSDIYSLGATLYDLFTQHPPFEGNSFEVLMKLAQQEPVPIRNSSPHLPKDLETIVMKCLEKDPDRRYESARPLANDLQHYLQGEPILARPSSRSYRLLKKIKKHKTVVSIVALSVFLVLVFGSVGIYSWWRTEKQLRLTQQVTETVTSVEWQMRVEHTMPLHDIRRAKLQVRNLMKSIQENLMHAGDLGYGPAQYMLGRGYMTLQDIPAGETHLKEAWTSGYERPEVAHALGLALGIIYQQNLNSVKGMEESRQKKQKLDEIQKKYRDPALKYLLLGQHAQGSAPEYVLALISFYEEKYDESLKYCEQVLDRSPWLYEVKILEGNLYAAMGDKVINKDADQGIGLYMQSQEAFRQASIIGASDPEVYIRMCDVGQTILKNSFYNKGTNVSNSWAQIKGSCENAIRVDPENPIAYASSSHAQQEWAFFQGYIGEDPRPALQKSIQDAQRAVQIEPGNPKYQLALGDAYLYFMGDASPRGLPLQETAARAIQSYWQAAEKESSFDLFNNLAYSYWYKALDQIDRGNNALPTLEESIKVYQRAIKIAPAAVSPYSNLIAALSTKAEYEMENGRDPNGSIDAAFDVFQRSRKVNQKYAFAIRNVSEVYLLRGRYEMMKGRDPRTNFEMAFDFGEQAHRLNPGIAGNFYSGVAKRYLAQYEREQGMNSSASLEEAGKLLEELARQKIEYSPFYVEAAEVWLERARIFSIRKISAIPAFDKGEEHLDQALRINPNYSWSYVTRGKLFLLKAVDSGSPAHLRKAEEALQHALQLKPDNAEAHCLLGMVQTQFSRFEKDPVLKSTRVQEAEKFLQQGLNLNRFLRREYRPAESRSN